MISPGTLFFYDCIMRTKMTKLVKHITSKDVRNILRKHWLDIIENHTQKTINILVDKKYAMHFLMRSANLKFLLDGVETLYGTGYKTSLKAIVHGDHHDREMNIPHMIHF